MQQDRGGSEEMNRRLKPMQGDQQQPQPQICPRCESLNTKFCYYNNYSLSQPRYFCKTCRRYWTHGGTLRNVPVGGGCRKGKRASKTTSSSGESTSRPPHQSLHNLGTSQNVISTSSGNNITASPALRRTGKESGILVSPTGIASNMGSSYYPGAAGFLNSLDAIQSLNNQPVSESFTYHQPVNLGGDLGGSSNLGLLHGFNAAVASIGAQQQQKIQQPRQFYNMGNIRDNKSALEFPFYSYEEKSIRSSRPPGSSQHQNWQQNLTSSGNFAVSDTALWSISTTAAAAGNSNNISGGGGGGGCGGSTSLNPDDQWNDLPGYGSPP